MTIARMTTADVLALNSSEAVVGLIVEAMKRVPELMTIGASPVSKTSYKTLVQTAEPTVAFRAAGTFRETQKPTLAARDVACLFLDASWDIDEAAARGCEWGVDRALEIQAMAHMLSAMKHIAKQTYYGTAADSNGFAGLASLLAYTDSDMVVNAGGDAAGAATSVFAIRSGIQDVQYAWGQDGQISEGEIQRMKLFDGDGKSAWGWAQAISGFVGLQMTNHTAAGRICNICDADGERLTDDLIDELLAQFDEAPTGLYMTKEAARMLKDSRTATSPTGAPAPWVTKVQGLNGEEIPVHITSSISNTETLLTVTPTT